MPKRPVYGFLTEDYDKVQKQMLGFCNLIRPAYFLKLSLEEIGGIISSFSKSNFNS